MAEHTYTQEEYLSEQVEALRRKVEEMKRIIGQMEAFESKPLFRTEGLTNSEHVEYLTLRNELRHKIKTTI